MSNRQLIERLEGVLTNHRYESIFTGCDGFSQSEIETMEETIELLKSQEWCTDMESAPRNGDVIVGLCKHDANEYHTEDGKLTPYGAHDKSFGHCEDGPQLIVWGGEYTDRDWETGLEIYNPNWWFVKDSNFEKVANPIAWYSLPPMEEG